MWLGCDFKNRFQNSAYEDTNIWKEGNEKKTLTKRRKKRRLVSLEVKIHGVKEAPHFSLGKM